MHLRVGERFAGERGRRATARASRSSSSLVHPARSRCSGATGWTRRGCCGSTRLASGSSAIAASPARSSSRRTSSSEYLRDEGLERIIDDRAARKESQTARAGTILAKRQVAPAIRRRSGRPRVRPCARHDARVRARGRSHGATDGRDARSASPRRPSAPGIAGGRLSKGCGRHRTEAKEELRARTDKDGRIVVPVTGGVWLLKSVHMERAAAGSGADWDSVWTALTFRVRPHSTALEKRLHHPPALLFQHAAGDLQVVIEPGSLVRAAGETSAPAFGSGAPNTTRAMRAWIIAPTHIRHGSTVT